MHKNSGLFLEEDTVIDPDFSIFERKNGRFTYPGSSQVECYYILHSSNAEMIKKEIKEIILEIITGSSHQEESGAPQDKETNNG